MHDEIAALASSLGVPADSLEDFTYFIETTLENMEHAYSALREERDAAVEEAIVLRRALLKIRLHILGPWGSTSSALWHTSALRIEILIQRTLAL